MKNLKPGKHLYIIYYEKLAPQNEAEPVTQNIIFVRRIKDFDKTNVIKFYSKKVY